MRPHEIAPRAIVLTVCFAIGTPSPAFGLRTQGSDSETVLSGLEEALLNGRPPLDDRKKRGLYPRFSAVSAAGLEENEGVFVWKIFGGILSEKDRRRLEELVAPLPPDERSEMAGDIQDAYRYFERRAPHDRKPYPPDAPEQMIRWLLVSTGQEKVLLRQLFLQLKTEEYSDFEWMLAERAFWI